MESAYEIMPESVVYEHASYVQPNTMRYPGKPRETLKESTITSPKSTRLRYPSGRYMGGV